MKYVVFMPHCGEFGWFIVHYIRRVQFVECDKTRFRKVVCCRPGQEVYFPSADEFYYQWSNPIPEANRSGTGADYATHPSMLALEATLRRRYPGCHIERNERFPPVRESEFSDEWARRIQVPLCPRRRGLKTDLVLGPRWRLIVQPERNWDHWPALFEMLHRAGISFAISGIPGSVRDSAYAAYRTWDYPDADAEIELLQNCKAYVGSNSGVSHLAAMIGCPSLVLAKSSGDGWMSMMGRMHNGKLHVIEDADPSAKEVFQRIRSVLGESFELFDRPATRIHKPLRAVQQMRR